jgi:hypothetical protein
VYTALLVCVMRVPVGQWPSAPNGFVVKKQPLLQRKSGPDYARKA